MRKGLRLTLCGELVKTFKSPKRAIGPLNAEHAARLVSGAADIAFVVDRKGTIRDVSCDDQALAEVALKEWIGKPWVDTVTVESREKIEALLADAAADKPQRWRQVNHPVPGGGQDLAVRYYTVQIGDDGRILAIGRDLRAVAELQQRLVRAEQRMEREYTDLRAAEARYRVLFQLASEAVLVVDADTMRIIEANPFAVAMLANGSRRMIGRQLSDLVELRDHRALDALVANVRGSPGAEETEVRLAHSSFRVRIAASLFRQDSRAFVLVRMSSASDATAAGSERSTRSLAVDVMQHLPDGVVIVDEKRRILSANAAFLELVELGGEDQARGQPLSRWVGRLDVDLDILFANLREHGSVRRYLTSVRSEFGGDSDVEISGVSVPDGAIPCAGFSIRRMPRESFSLDGHRRTTPLSIEQMTELVGRVPLKDLVRETTDIIERMCIEAALELTGDNRASAAEMLGLSRQSLYVKLRRFGLGELDSEVV